MVCVLIQNRLKNSDVVEIEPLERLLFFLTADVAFSLFQTKALQIGLTRFDVCLGSWIFAYSAVKMPFWSSYPSPRFHWTVDLLPMDGFWNCWIPFCVSRCSGGVHVRDWECCRLLRVDCLDQVSSLDPGCWSMDLQSSRRPSPCESSGVTTYPGQLLVGVLSHLRIIYVF